MTDNKLKQYIIDVPNFPKDGVVFKDISLLLKDYFADVIDSFISLYSIEMWNNVDYFAGIDARGFVFASALANHFNKGIVMVRKSGKLPPPIISEEYSLEYGKNKIEIAKGCGNIMLIDDVLATGGTLFASANLCKKAGYNILGIATLIDLRFLNNFKWNYLQVKSIIQYE